MHTIHTTLGPQPWNTLQIRHTSTVLRSRHLMLMADGKGWTLTPVLPRGDEKGRTCAARGAVRYLRLHFSFLGTDGINQWQEQQQVERHIIDSFFARCESLRLTITQFAQVKESVLFGKLLYSWRISPPCNEVMTSVTSHQPEGSPTCSDYIEHWPYWWSLQRKH
jgi:hypothetical protein